MPVYLDTRGNSVLSIGICDRCNRKMAYVDLMPDPNFPGMRVCKEDLDDYDPWRLPALQTENIALRFPRPDVSIALTPNEILTEGAVGDSLFIDGVPAGNTQGDLNTGSSYGPIITPINPIIYYISPINGPQAGGTVVTITGKNFLDAVNVKFGGANCPSFTIISDTHITAIAPAYPIAGIVDVAVLTSAVVGVLHGAFTYTT